MLRRRIAGALGKINGVQETIDGTQERAASLSHQIEEYQARRKARGAEKQVACNSRA